MCAYPTRPFYSIPYRHAENSHSQKKRYCILSIDGGGIRGIIPGKILQQIENETKQAIAKSFNMVGGTSTGGILAVGLSLPDLKNPNNPRYTASEVLDFYLNKRYTENIFKRPHDNSEALPSSQTVVKAERSHTKAAVHFREYTLPFLQKPPAIAELTINRGALEGRVLGKKVLEVSSTHEHYNVRTGVLNASIPKKSVKNINSYKMDSDYEGIRLLVQPKFIARGIEGVLRDRFGNTKLSELLPEEVLVTAFNTSTMRHKIFSKFNVLKCEEQNILAWKAARASSAAPTYFPAFKIGEHEYVDGGVCMNNPALALLSQAKKMKIPKKNIFCVSLGTGVFTQPIAPTAHFGLVQWAPSIFDAACFGMSSQTEEYMSSMLKEHQYVRIQVDLPSNIALDKYDDATLAQLDEAARLALKQNAKQLEKIYQALTQ